MTQLDRVLRHLKDFGSITSWQAFTEYGITRLSAIIYNLKEMGYVFEDEWVHTINRYGEKTSFKRYVIYKDDYDYNDDNETL